MEKQGIKYLRTIESTVYEDYFINNIRTGKLSEKYNVPIYTVQYFIKVMWGLKPLSTALQKYKIDLSLFEMVDCEWKYYFLGWMFSDGNIYTGAGKNTISLCITESDKYILDYFNEKIYNGEKPLNYRKSTVRKDTDYICKPLWRFQIDSAKICKDLISLGLIQNKSLTKIFPQWITKENMPHFIRGYFEGNGTVGINNNKDSLFVKIYSGSEKFLTSMGEILSNVLYIPVKFTKDRDTTFHISFGKREYVESFYSYIYGSCEMSLDRKREKFTYKNNTLSNG